MKPKEDMYKHYFACLQSLVYLASHMKMPYGIEEKNLSILFTELTKGMPERGAEIWIDEKEGINIFHALARSQVNSSELFYEAVRIFSKDLGVMMLHQDKHGFTPLNTACKEGKVTLVETLLSEASVVLSDGSIQNLLNQPNNHGYTPFMSAYHTLPLLKILSEKIKTLDLTQKTINGNTVLMLACLYGKHQAVDFLLEKAEKESKETVLYLLHHQNHDHDNVLHIALRKKDYASLDTILEYAAKNMNCEELKAYCTPIIKGRDVKAITNMLYQAKQNCLDFKQFIYEASRVLPTNLMERWAHVPQISQRIRKYLQASDEAGHTADTANNEKESADNLEASASANKP